MREPTKTLVPKLRFLEFKDSGEWEEKTLGKIGKIVTGNTPITADIDNYGGNRLFVSPADISEQRFIYSTKTTLSEKGYSKTRKIPANSILFVCIGSTIGKIAQNKIDCATNQQINAVIPFQGYSNNFVYYSLDFNSSKIAELAGKHAVPIVNKSLFSTVIMSFPLHDEQQKIADCLSSIDELITAQTQKIAALKDHKKGLMQQLFPAEGETTPKLRFHEFQDAGDWKEKTLDECLDYQQPIPYLVSDTNYSDAFKTPVLTAGKTFILGYTNEQNGIFSDNLPVIIFDDFTTATQFVDFPFKAKSSAMKILLEKSGANIKFMYELMQMVAYEVGTHERHWISKFAPMTVLIPSPDEQKKIADCLSSIDDLINAQTQKLESYKIHKKGLMQQLFPNTVEVVE